MPTWLAGNRATVRQCQSNSTRFRAQHFPVPELFLASVQLCPLSPIGRALTCQTAWNDPRVEKEANTVLGEDRHHVQQVIRQRRVEALQEFKEAFAIMKTREQEAFLEDSYF